MALTLTLQEGEGFWIGDRRWYVESYDDDGIWLVGPPAHPSKLTKIIGWIDHPALEPTQRIRITEKEAVEIEPEVFAQEGFIPEMGCRIALEAPRKIAILRDELYQRGVQGAQSGSHVSGKRT